MGGSALAGEAEVPLRQALANAVQVSRADWLAGQVPLALQQRVMILCEVVVSERRLGERLRYWMTKKKEQKSNINNVKTTTSSRHPKAKIKVKDKWWSDTWDGIRQQMRRQEEQLWRRFATQLLRREQQSRGKKKKERRKEQEPDGKKNKQEEESSSREEDDEGDDEPSPPAAVFEIHVPQYRSTICVQYDYDCADGADGRNGINGSTKKDDLRVFSLLIWRGRKQ